MERLTITLWLAGWIAITAGIAAIVQGRYIAAVWLVSIGVALIGVGGFRPLRQIMTIGIREAAHRDRDR